MQMKIVNKLIQRISNVSRTLVPETSVVVSVGKVQFVENVEAEAKSGKKYDDPPPVSIRDVDSRIFFWLSAWHFPSLLLTSLVA
jgi:hypothetical protein